jgi:hypothetical protein
MAWHPIDGIRRTLTLIIIFDKWKLEVVHIIIKKLFHRIKIKRFGQKIFPLKYSHQKYSRQKYGANPGEANVAKLFFST